MNKILFSFLILAIGWLVFLIISAIHNENHGIIAGLVGLHGTLILAKLYKKD